MTGDEAVGYITAREVFGMRFGLERMHAVLGALGDPQHAAPAVHVVGTNGKSSTCRFAAAALAASGRRVGTYLSPHVKHWRERIRIDGVAVGERPFAEAVEQVAAAAAPLERGDPVTQFEVLTAAAFVVFARAGVEAVVVEAGLGGRWDATNVLRDAVVVLTNVALEHTELLGDTVAAIAAEKLAVAGDGSDRLVVGRLEPGAADDVRRHCDERGLTGWWMDRDVTLTSGRTAGRVDVVTPAGASPGLRCGPRGDFQQVNLAVGLAAAERLVGGQIPLAPLRAAMAAVTIPGRLEHVGAGPVIVLDGAHNPAGMRALASSLDPAAHRVAVVSVLDDKALEGMLDPLSTRCAALVATRSSHPRARDPAAIAAAAAGGIRVECVEDPLAAIGRARELAGSSGEVLVCGSLHLLADVRGPVIARWGDPPGMLADESAGSVRI